MTLRDRFATIDAPYIKYLEAIRGWPEADEVRLFLREATREVTAQREARPVNTADWKLASIHDIRSNIKGAAATVHEVTLLQGSSLCFPHDGVINVDGVNHFLQRIRECQSDTHMRIIVLHGPPNYLKSEATLLFCHILGMELDLQPAHVCMLAKGFRSGYQGPEWSHSMHIFPFLSRMRRHQLRGELASYIHFEMFSGDPTFAAAALGRRKVGDHTPFLGKGTNQCTDSPLNPH